MDPFQTGCVRKEEHSRRIAVAKFILVVSASRTLPSPAPLGSSPEASKRRGAGPRSERMHGVRTPSPRLVCQLPMVTLVPEKLRLSAARDVGVWLHPAQSSEGGAPTRLRLPIAGLPAARPRPAPPLLIPS